jgi:hypothetical protein
MKKIIYFLLTVFIILNTSCSQDFLEPVTPSQVDENFIFTTPEETYKVLVGCYDIWQSADHPLYYEQEVAGSDSECHPEAYSAQGRHIPEGLFASEYSINDSGAAGFFTAAYSIIYRTNVIIQNI